MATTGKPIRVYADASVYGGAFDVEFKSASEAFFDGVRSGNYRLVMSPAISDELENAPPQVLVLFEEMEELAETIEITEDAIRLQQAYLEASIVGPQWETDALHVALATTARCSAIISWNFKHIVNFKKIPLYNGVNLVHGYGSIAIHAPQEVVADED
jgi:hypothetical protein